MYSLIDMTTEQAQTSIVLCGSCVIADRDQATPIAILDVEHPDHPHSWGNCDDAVAADRRCDMCGHTAAEANRRMMSQVAERLARKAADPDFARSYMGTQTSHYGLSGATHSQYDQHGLIYHGRDRDKPRTRRGF
jgi:hypothetical protein